MLRKKLGIDSKIKSKKGKLSDDENASEGFPF
jgi:hypothetical protein